MDEIYFRNQKNSNFITPEFIESMKKRRQLILDNPEKFAKMPPRMRKILEYRYCINQPNNFYMSAPNIAKKMKISNDRVYKLNKEAFQILEKDWN